MGEYPGGAERRALRRRDKGAAAQLSRQQDAHADNPHRDHQAQRGLSRAVSRHLRALLRPQGPRPWHGYFGGLPSILTVKG